MKRTTVIMALVSASLAVSCARNADISMPSVIRPGDFLLADGSVLSRDTDAETVRNANVIGIVFSTDTSLMSDYDKQYLRDKGVRTPLGFALSLRNAGDGTCKWYEDTYTGAYLKDEKEIGVTDVYAESDSYATYRLADRDFNGLENTVLIRQSRQEEFEEGDYPAFSAAYSYNDIVPAPENATEWYFPSCGQFLEIVRNLAGATLEEENMIPANDNDFIWENQGKVVSAINSSMGKVSGDLKQPFREGDVYWTSSPAMPTEACFIYFDDGGSVFVLRSLKNSSNSVRPVLGFGSF